MSSWTRAIVIALSIVHAANPAAAGARRIHSRGALPAGCPGECRSVIRSRSAGAILSAVRPHPEALGAAAAPSFIRSTPSSSAPKWMLEQLKHSDGLGAIYPPMMYAIMALDVLGYGPDHPLRVEAEKQFNKLMVDDERRLLFQPCFSPVWDTAIAAYALAKTGNAPARLAAPGADWLLTKEVRHKGDWSVKRPEVEPSGWAFEFANEFYPGYRRHRHGAAGSARTPKPRIEVKQRACESALSTGCWPCSPRMAAGRHSTSTTTGEFLSHVPFADHNAMLDPTCPDITGRVHRGLGALRHATEVIRPSGAACEYLLRTQEPDGSWYGRWGVNYIYGTFLALRGLARRRAMSEHEPYILLRASSGMRSIRTPMAAGAKAAPATTTAVFTAGPALLRKRLGPYWVCWPAAITNSRACTTASNI